LSYKPTAIPSDAPAGLRAWLADQLRRIADELSAPSVTRLNLAQMNAAPTKYRDGDIVYADGTNWNPGSGQGIYARYGGAWVKL
jgi:hypothetical protein